MSEALSAKGVAGLLERRCRFIYGCGRLYANLSGAYVVPPSWNDRDPAWKTAFAQAVELQLSDQAAKTPEESHQRWIDAQTALGWTYGKVYDPTKKTHPNLVPWSQLPQREQEKDRVFMALCVIAQLSFR